MPKKLHRKLARSADKLAAKGKLEDRGAYIHGTMQKIAKRKATKRKRGK